MSTLMSTWPTPGSGVGISTSFHERGASYWIARKGTSWSHTDCHSISSGQGRLCVTDRQRVDGAEAAHATSAPLPTLHGRVYGPKESQSWPPSPSKMHVRWGLTLTATPILGAATKGNSTSAMSGSRCDAAYFDRPGSPSAVSSSCTCLITMKPTLHWQEPAGRPERNCVRQCCSARLHMVHNSVRMRLGCVSV